MKLEWVQKHWGVDKAEEAEKVIEKSMLAFCTASRRASVAAAQSTIRPLPIALPSRTSAPVSASTSSASAPSAHPPASHSEAAELANDKLIVHTEFLRYKQAGLLAGEALEYFDLENRSEFPTLYKIALDTIPVQASSVPCERAFSSSKETVTLRQNRLSLELMEALQILKHTYHHPLNFASHLVTDPETLQIDDDSPSKASNPPLMLGLLEECLGDEESDSDNSSNSNDE
ncbi:hypothetical protein FRC04_007023 [Tulasnella sp. 424]|nr:hypothetical protein FRC04_007023 [Tulasnella sp. 424]